MGMTASLAEAVGHQAFTRTKRANSLQFLLEVGVLGNQLISQSYKHSVVESCCLELLVHYDVLMYGDI